MAQIQDELSLPTLYNVKRLQSYEEFIKAYSRLLNIGVLVLSSNEKRYKAITRHANVIELPSDKAELVHWYSKIESVSANLVPLLLSMQQKEFSSITELHIRYYQEDLIKYVEIFTDFLEKTELGKRINTKHNIIRVFETTAII